LDDQYQVATGLAAADAHGDYRLFSDYESRLEQVTASDVHAVATKYFTPQHFVLMAIFPPGQIPDGFEGAIREAAGRHGGPGTPILSRTLASGATLLYEARPGGAMESFTLVVHSGDRDGETPGLASAVAEMMTRRTKDLDKRALQDRLDRSGLSLRSWTTPDAAFFTLQAPAGSTTDAAAILVDVVTTPAFTEEEWAAVQNELVARLDGRLDQPRAVAFDALGTMMFPGTGYGRSIEETRRGIAGLTLNDLNDLWKRRYRTESMAIAYSGGASIELVAGALSQLDRIRGAAPPREIIRAEPLGGVARVAKPMDGKAQANLYLAWPAPPIDSDDWILWELAERAIGGDLAGRLWKLRQEEGLAYSVWLSSTERRDVPITHVYMATAAETRDRALLAIDREIRRALEGLTAEELERVKLSHLADMNRSDRTAAARSLRMSEWWVQGFPMDRRERLRRVIEGASLDEVNRVVRSVLNPDRYYFAEAGAVPQ
jgi:predicted Zn-dependent peptidase